MGPGLSIAASGTGVDEGSAADEAATGGDFMKLSLEETPETTGGAPPKDGPAWLSLGPML